MGLAVLVLLGVLAASSTSCVRTGHVGVVTVFGRVTGRVMGEGIHLVNPVARVHELDIKTREVKERASVPTKEGLIMGVEASVIYHLDSQRAAEVLQTIGADYAEVLLIPNFRSAIRAVTAANTASSLYSDAREGIARQILADLQAVLAPRGIRIENVLLRDLQPPETLKHAIEAKQQAQQEAQRMEYVLLREKQESERKRVEAQGIKDFQNIVSEGISEKLLDWKGIEATVELARSSNAKVVVIGNTKSGLPLIFSGDSK
jgi:regulator of protease activity HflC (stomatin/prohibitin superfamily)